MWKLKHMLIAFSAVAACVGATAVTENGGLATGSPEDLVMRYGPWGVVAILLSASIWSQRRLVRSIDGIRVCLARMVEILADHPCLVDDKDRLRKLIDSLNPNHGDETS